MAHFFKNLTQLNLAQSLTSLVEEVYSGKKHIEGLKVF